MICTQCGVILEFEDPEIERLQDAVAKRLGGFEVTEHRHELFGLCEKARGIENGRCPNEEPRRTAAQGNPPADS